MYHRNTNFVHIIKKWANFEIKKLTTVNFIKIYSLISSQWFTGIKFEKIYIIIVSRTHYSVLFVIKREKIFELHFIYSFIVASEASDPTFKTIHFQYYTLVALIQINTSGTVRRRRRRRSRFQGVETPPKPIHISKNRLCSLKAGSAKGAEFHLLVNICTTEFFMTVFLFKCVKCL